MMFLTLLLDQKDLSIPMRKQILRGIGACHKKQLTTRLEWYHLVKLKDLTSLKLAAKVKALLIKISQPYQPLIL